MADSIRHVIHSFAPIIDKDCTLLILGSVPSVKSEEFGFYYMHKQNRFWRILSALIREDLINADNNKKTETLLKNKIALFDTVKECDIEGSGDNTVKNIVVADIPKLIQNTEIKTIYCNGNLSYKLLLKAYPNLKNISVKLPSTSPANASFSFEKLLKFWSVIVSFPAVHPYNAL